MASTNPPNVVLIDWNNIKHFAYSYAGQIDGFRQVYRLFKGIYGDGVSMSVVAGVPSAREAERTGVLVTLREIGFTVHTVRGTWTKANADIAIAVHAMKQMYENPNLKHLILFSGDRDFIPLLDEARGKGIETSIVAASRETLSEGLSAHADHTYLMADLIGRIKTAEQTPP